MTSRALVGDTRVCQGFGELSSEAAEAVALLVANETNPGSLVCWPSMPKLARISANRCASAAGDDGDECASREEGEREGDGEVAAGGGEAATGDGRCWCVRCF